MRIRISCFQCRSESVPYFELAAPFPEESIFEIECDRHGKSAVEVGNLRFEILFEFGALSAADCRTREAVLDFGAALERFAEWFIEFARLRRGVAEGEYSKYWKHVKNASERQLGGFMLAYILETGHTAPFPHDWPQFRNRVVHQGYVPRTDEVVDHGEALRKFMCFVIDQAKSIDRDKAIDAGIRETIKRKRPQSDVPVSTMFLPTLIHLPREGQRRTLPEFVTTAQDHWSRVCAR